MEHNSSLNFQSLNGASVFVLHYLYYVFVLMQLGFMGKILILRLKLIILYRSVLDLLTLSVPVSLIRLASFVQCLQLFN